MAVQFGVFQFGADGFGGEGGTVTTVVAAVASLALSAGAPNSNRILKVAPPTASLALAANAPSISTTGTQTVLGTTAQLALSTNIPDVSIATSLTNPIRAPGGEEIGVYSWDGAQHRPVTITFAA